MIGLSTVPESRTVGGMLSWCWEQLFGDDFEEEKVAKLRTWATLLLRHALTVLTMKLDLKIETTIVTDTGPRYKNTFALTVEVNHGRQIRPCDFFWSIRISGIFRIWMECSLSLVFVENEILFYSGQGRRKSRTKHVFCVRVVDIRCLVVHTRGWSLVHK